MKQLLRACSCMLITFIAYSVNAQDSSVVTFSFDKTRVSSNEVVLNIKGKIRPGIKLYGLQRSGTDPLFSTITFDSSVATQLSGSLIESMNVRTEKDVTVDAEVRYFSDSVTWHLNSLFNLK